MTWLMELLGWYKEPETPIETDKNDFSESDDVPKEKAPEITVDLEKKIKEIKAKGAKPRTHKEIAEVIEYWIENGNARKAAHAMIGLGVADSAEVFKHLGNINELVLEISKTRSVSDEEVAAALHDLEKTSQDQYFGGIAYANTTLEKAFGRHDALSILSKLTAAFKVRPMDIVNNEDPLTIYQIIKQQLKDQEFGETIMKRVCCRALWLLKEKFEQEYSSFDKKKFYSIITRTGDNFTDTVFAMFLIETLPAQIKREFIDRMRTSDDAAIQKRGQYLFEKYYSRDNDKIQTISMGVVFEPNVTIDRKTDQVKASPSLEALVPKADQELAGYIEEMNNKAIAFSLSYILPEMRAQVIEMLLKDDDTCAAMLSILGIMNKGSYEIKFKLFEDRFRDEVVREIERVYEMQCSKRSEDYQHPQQLSGVDVLVMAMYENPNMISEVGLEPQSIDCLSQAQQAHLTSEKIMTLREDYLKLALGKINDETIIAGLSGVEDHILDYVISCIPRDRAAKILTGAVTQRSTKTEMKNGSKELCKQIYFILRKHHPSLEFKEFYAQ